MNVTPPRAGTQGAAGELLTVPASDASQGESFAGVLSGFGPVSSETPHAGSPGEQPSTDMGGSAIPDGPTEVNAAAARIPSVDPRSVATVGMTAAEDGSGTADLQQAPGLDDVGDPDDPTGLPLALSAVDPDLLPRSVAVSVDGSADASGQRVKVLQDDMSQLSARDMGARSAALSGLRHAQPMSGKGGSALPSEAPGGDSGNAAPMLRDRLENAAGSVNDPATPSRRVGSLEGAALADAEVAPGDARVPGAHVVPGANHDPAFQVLAEHHAAQPRETQHNTALQSTPALPMTLDGDWADNMAPRLLQFGAHGGGRMVVQLHPAELGRMEVALEVDRDDVRVSFTVHHGSARDLVDAHVPRLRELLSAQGFDNIDVDVSAGNGGYGGDGPGTGRDRSETDRAPIGSALGDIEADILGSPGVAISEGLVDAYA